MLRFTTVATIVLFVAVVSTTSVEARLIEEQADHAQAPGTGEIVGFVTSETGERLSQILLSVSGTAGTSVAKSDVSGRFKFQRLDEGQYLLRSHHSDLVSRSYIVEVRRGVTSFHNLTLVSGQLSSSQSLSLTVAGIVPVVSLSGAEVFTQGLEIDLEESIDAANPSAPEEPNASDARPHDHSPKGWFLRRVRRSVLKDYSWESTGTTDTPVQAWPKSASTSEASRLPVSGEVQFLTRSTFDRNWKTGQGLPGQVAYFSVMPGEMTDSDSLWAVRGAVNMTAGNASSWAVSGWYTDEPNENHAFNLKLSYSRQQFSGRTLPMISSGGTGSGRRNREVAGLQAFHSWSVSPHLAFGLGVDFAGYGYLENGKLFSPRATITVVPMNRTRLRLSLSRRMTAPGAEEFLPPGSGVWLPPERTFSLLSRSDSLRPERVHYAEVAVERDVGSASVVGVRRFKQDVSDQLITIFGDMGHSFVDKFSEPGGHYYIARAHGVTSTGWGLKFGHELSGRFQGELDYSVVRAEWLPEKMFEQSNRAHGAFRSGSERFHDVTMSARTTIPETSTRVLVLCRLSNGFARLSAVEAVSGVDARFDVRVTQSLPFSPFDGSTWELLIALRSLFHEPAFDASSYDELLVVNPPQQFVGGLVVHF